MASKIEKRIAWLISTLGHPVLLITAFVILVNYREFERATAARLSLLVIGFVVIPVCTYIIIKMRRGEYRNFDVSDRKNRKSLYPFVLFLQLLLFLYISLKDYTWLIKSGLISSMFLVFSGYLINLRLKVSMHSSIAFFLSALLIYIQMELAFSTLLFAVLIAWSRVILGRHSVPEIAVGLVLGFSGGAFFHFLIQMS